MPVILPHGSARPTSNDRKPAPATPAALEAWRILGWLGAAFFVMSTIDVILGWYPASPGSPEWRFGTISATIAGLAIPTFGLYLILASTMARGLSARLRGLAGILVLLVIVLAALFGMYAAAAAPVLQSVATNAVVHLGLKKSIVKTVTLFVGYEALFVLGAKRAFGVARLTEGV